MQIRKTKLIVGAGRVYFKPSEPGTAQEGVEIYIGNTPAFSVTRVAEMSTRTRSVQGRKYESEPTLISEKITGVMSTDNITPENLARWFGANIITNLMYGARSDVDFRSYHGSTLDLEDAIQFNGYSKKISELEVYKNNQLIELSTNIDTSEFLFGRIKVQDYPKDIQDGDLIRYRVTTVNSKELSISEGGFTVRGSLRFVSRNAVGDPYEYHFPDVSLTSSGSIDFKSGDFQTHVFSMEAYKKSSEKSIYYITLPMELTDNEKALQLLGQDFYDFIITEDKLDRFVNIEMPSYF